MPITLTSLPPEIIQQIASYLPSASSIISLDLTCRQLHQAISLDDYRLFRGFALAQFPSITFPPFWNEATRALTTRSRAWDRKGFLSRVLLPRVRGTPDERADITSGMPIQRLGYAPSLDSYEEWTGWKWADRVEVVAWGAGPKIVIRRRARTDSAAWEENRLESRFWARYPPVRTEWAVMGSIENESAHDDILDLRLLRPSQWQGQDQNLVVRRANNEMARIRCSVDDGKFYHEALFRSRDPIVEAMDLSPAPDPFLATCHPTGLGLFPCKQEGNVSPTLIQARAENQGSITKGMSLKFLNATKFTLAEKFLGRIGECPIKVYTIGEDRLSVTSTTWCSPDGQRESYRYYSSALAPLPPVPGYSSADSGHVFLAGWSDGVIRLHDDRCPLAVSEYVDTVDQGLIASIMPIGHESFVAGGHQNACMKLFDLRVTGSRPYSYLNSRPSKNPLSVLQDSSSSGKLAPHRTLKHRTAPQQSPRSQRRLLTNMNILISLPLDNKSRIYSPNTSTQQNPHHARRGQYSRPRASRYNGSIYSLTLPSPSSRTFYAGIENHVLQFDIAATDDIVEGSRLDHDWDLGLANDDAGDKDEEGGDLTPAPSPGAADYSLIFQLSGYNRPPPLSKDSVDQFISEDKVELRGQISIEDFEREVRLITGSTGSKTSNGVRNSAKTRKGSSSSAATTTTTRRGVREGWD